MRRVGGGGGQEEEECAVEGRERRREGAKDVRKEKTRNKDCTYADVHEE